VSATEIGERGGGPPARPSLRHALRRRIAASPALYLALARRKPDTWALDRRTQIVIDAFPRSANTFAVIAFQLAQQDHVRVAHHTHAPASVIAAARRGIPVLVPTREPASSVVSSTIRDPEATVGQWLKTYVAFYETIRPYRDRIVTATFEETTTDLGAAIRRVNERFGTAFREFEHSAETQRAVFSLIDERSAGPPWQPHLNRFASGVISAEEYLAITAPYREAPRRESHVRELRVPRPSDVRDAVKARVEERYRDESLAALRVRAEAAFMELTA
jgi:hypothetical protein